MTLRLCRIYASKAVFTLFLLGYRIPVPAQGTSQPPQRTPESLNDEWVSASAAAQDARTAQLTVLQQTLAKGPFHPDWPSLQTHGTPDWFNDAKFGIFIHWGVFSVPAFGSEWYSRNMYQEGTPDFKHHLATYGPQSKFGYKDFIPLFRMEHFDPDSWASLFQRAGARYVVPVAEHHDGFALYKTALSPWNAVDMGPHRDLVGDLATAVRAHGMKLGLSSHRAEHDWFFDGGRSFPSDVNDPRYAGFYGPAVHRDLESTNDASLSKDYTYLSREYRADWLARSVEIVERYHPDLMYFDWWVGFPDFRETEERFAAFYYDNAAQSGRAVVMNTKYDNMASGAGTLDVERGGLSGIQAQPWQTDTSLSNASWGYIEGDTYKTPQVLLDELIDVVSKNGNLLLNIGPRADGTIPEPAQQTLLSMGDWLHTNGEAIYGTRPWKNFGEGPTKAQAGSFGDNQAVSYTAEDFRFTTRAGFVYALEMRRPADGKVLIHSLGSSTGAVAAVALLGYPGKVDWQQAPDGLHITFPAQTTGVYAATFRIRLQ